MRPRHLAVLATALGIGTPAAWATVTLNSMSRSVTGGEIGPVFSGSGPFMDARSGIADLSTGAFPNGRATWAANQTSNISTSGLSFDSRVSVSLSATPPNASFTAQSLLRLVFTVDSPQEVSYQWGSVVSPFLLTLTGPGSTAIPLTANGTAQSLMLQPGQYTFYASNTVSVFNFFPSLFLTQSGNFNFVPSPSAVTAALGLAGIFAVRRRRADGWPQSCGK
jgi:MYXO-CTERM domain-containing protein